eukprot:FR741036.1.p2 GENE.FR741036.1~~FR741036.1.p2  ORF type:complete len:164 (+),score=30.68 FR741036.1:534-1025(+)
MRHCGNRLALPGRRDLERQLSGDKLSWAKRSTVVGFCHFEKVKLCSSHSLRHQPLCSGGGGLHFLCWLGPVSPLCTPLREAPADEVDECMKFKFNGPPKYTMLEGVAVSYLTLQPQKKKKKKKKNRPQWMTRQVPKPGDPLIPKAARPPGGKLQLFVPLLGRV